MKEIQGGDSRAQGAVLVDREEVCYEPRRPPRPTPLSSVAHLRHSKPVYGLGSKVTSLGGGAPREQKMLTGHTYPESYITKYTSIRFFLSCSLLARQRGGARQL